MFRALSLLVPAALLGLLFLFFASAMTAPVTAMSDMLTMREADRMNAAAVTDAVNRLQETWVAASVGAPPQPQTQLLAWPTPDQSKTNCAVGAAKACWDEQNIAYESIGPWMPVSDQRSADGSPAEQELLVRVTGTIVRRVDGEPDRTLSSSGQYFTVRWVGGQDGVIFAPASSNAIAAAQAAAQQQQPSPQ